MQIYQKNQKLIVGTRVILSLSSPSVFMSQKCRKTEVCKSVKSVCFGVGDGGGGGERGGRRETFTHTAIYR